MGRHTRRTTRRAPRPLPVAALAMATVLAAAGCSGRSDRQQADAEHPTSTAADAGQRATTAVDPGMRDQATADDVVLGPADFPPGWSQDNPGPADPARPERLDDLASCLGTELLADDDVVARSPRFDDRMVGHVAATVVVTPSPEAAERLMEVVHRPDMPTCLGSVVIDELAAEQAMVAEVGLPDMPTPGEPRASTLSFPPMGDDTASARVVIAQTYDDPSGRYQPAVIDLFSDAVFVRVDRVVIVAMFTSGVGGPFDATRAQDMVELMVDRVPPEEAGE